MGSTMDASANTPEVNESVPSPQTPRLATDRPNALALQYLRQPSSSSIAMMRNAFKGLLNTHN